MSYGTNWGTNWGGAAVAVGFSVVEAFPTSNQTFVVTFTVQPIVASPIGPTDASNLANITLVRTDTNETISLLTSRPVDGDLESVEYFLLGQFLSPLITYQVTAANLVSAFDDPLIDPKVAQFDGLPSAQLPAEQLRPLLDLKNPQTDGDLFNSGLIIGTNADYELEGGVDLIRKLIIRRIITAQDEFFHLSDRNYGLGIEAKLTFTDSDLVAFRAQLQREVAKESEINAVTVKLQLTADNVLNIIVRAVLQRTGQQIEVSVPLETNTTTVIGQ